MAKKQKWTTSYKRYRDEFYKEKNRGNIKTYEKVYSQKEFYAARKDGFTRSQIVNDQKIFKTEGQERAFYRKYLKLKKEYSRGETVKENVNYFAKSNTRYDIVTEEKEIEIKYHYNLSGLLKDRKAMHFLITFRIDSGEDQKEVLADYGY